MDELKTGGITDRIIYGAERVGLHTQDFTELMLLSLTLVCMVMLAAKFILIKTDPDYQYSKWYGWLWPAHHLFAFFAGLLLMRVTLFQPYHVTDNKLAPKLIAGDHVLIKKFQYDLRLPILPYPLWRFEGPRRGELVIFHLDDVPGRLELMRIVGLPGEHIRTNRRTGEVYIDGRLLPRTNLGSLEEQLQTGVLKAEENLDEIRAVISKKIKTVSALGAWLPDDGRTIPENSYFAMYDQRDACCDSREFGVIPRNAVVGRAVVIFMNDSNGLQLNRNGFLK